jgi:hypothetical protein
VLRDAEGQRLVDAAIDVGQLDFERIDRGGEGQAVVRRAVYRLAPGAASVKTPISRVSTASAA